MAGAQETMQKDGERALAEVATRLVALDADSVTPPSCDPHSAAATALLVADYLRQPDVRGKLDSFGLSLDAVVDLGRIARALFAVVVRLGGDYLPDKAEIPKAMIEQAEAVRATISAALEKALPDDADVKMWLAAIRLGSGVVDLVYDLRTLGDLCAKYLPGNASGNATSGAVKAARTAAHALELALRDGETPDMTKRRDAVARLWTLFVPAYETVANAGRELAKESGEERHFPPLALIASHRRARRRPLSIVPPSLGGASMPPRRMSVEMEVVGVDTIDLPKESIPPAEPARATVPFDKEEAGNAQPPSSAPVERLSNPEGRRDPRHKVEIEVGIMTDSNLYVGFTENLSVSGVFVATYTRKPIGSTIEVVMTLPDGEEVRVDGVVRWLRDSSADGWPGMGVQFEGLPAETHEKLKKFLSLREPLFYDD